ncbi:MAG TPA: phosphoribosylformylglycinamidine synthase, partial [Sorangium sp.]|nr:phosphoribosylformylglycinamidine synthase [Sorangium sp.]
MLILPAAAAHSPTRRRAYLTAIQQQNPGISHIGASFVHLVDVPSAFSAPQRALLKQLLTPLFDPCEADPPLPAAPAATPPTVVWVVPRTGTLSPWSTKASDIARLCGLTDVRRIERGVRWHIVGTIDDRPALERIIADRMTQTVVYARAALNSIFTRCQPRPLSHFAVLRDGRAAVEKANHDMGLALARDEIDYLVDAFRKLKRNPT